MQAPQSPLKRGTPVLTGDGARKDALPRRVGEKIGEGRMGPVHEVVPSSDRDRISLVVKVLSPPFDFVKDPSFLRDMDKARTIRGRNILAYKRFSDGTQGKIRVPHIVMYRANGRALHWAVQKAVERGEPWPLSRLYEVMCELIAAMEVINEQFVHRDLTLFNIMSVDGRWSVTDYGLSALAREATRQRIFCGSGSYPYIAPEAWGNALDAVTMDIYSLGMIFYRLATLRSPWDVNPDTAPAWEDAHRRQPVQPPHLFNPQIPPPLSEMILRMVEKDPGSRPSGWPAVWELMSGGAVDSPVNQMIRRAREERGQWESPEAAIERERKEQTESARRDLVAKQTAEYEAYKVRVASPEFQAFQAQEREKERLEQEKKSAVIRAEAAVYLSRIKQEIIHPLREWTDEQNRLQPDRKVTLDLEEKDNRVVCALGFPDGTTRTVKLEVLLERHFQVPFNPGDPWDHTTITEFPAIRERPIRVFGTATLGDGRGFNLIFGEGEYRSQDRWNVSPGEWFIQINRAGLPAPTNARPEPFALDEVKKLPESISQCRSEVRDYDVSHLRLFFNGVLPG